MTFQLVLFRMTLELVYFTTARQLLVVRVDVPALGWVCNGRPLLYALQQIRNVDIFGKGLNCNFSFAHDVNLGPNLYPM